METPGNVGEYTPSAPLNIFNTAIMRNFVLINIFYAIK